MSNRPSSLHLLLPLVAFAACAPASTGTWTATVTLQESSGNAPSELGSPYDVDVEARSRRDGCEITTAIDGLATFHTEDGGVCEDDGFLVIYDGATASPTIEVLDGVNVRVELVLGDTPRLELVFAEGTGEWTRTYRGTAID